MLSKTQKRAKKKELHLLREAHRAKNEGSRAMRELEARTRKNEARHRQLRLETWDLVSRLLLGSEITDSLTAVVEKKTRPRLNVGKALQLLSEHRVERLIEFVQGLRDEQRADAKKIQQGALDMLKGKWFKSRVEHLSALTKSPSATH